MVDGPLRLEAGGFEHGNRSTACSGGAGGSGERALPDGPIARASMLAHSPGCLPGLRALARIHSSLAKGSL
jgi:hypothetical protein